LGSPAGCDDEDDRGEESRGAHGYGVHRREPRVRKHGAAIGPWSRGLRLYSLIVVPLAVGRDLRLEFDGEQSAFANELATTGGAQWRYASAALSLRWALQ